MSQNPPGRHNRVIFMESCPRCSLHVDIYLNGELIGRALPIAEHIIAELARLVEFNVISREEAAATELVVLTNRHYLLTEEQMEVLMFQVFLGIGLVVDVPVEQIFGWPPKRVSHSRPAERRRQRS